MSSSDDIASVVSIAGKVGPIFSDSLILSVEDTVGNIEATKGPDLPSWVKGAAKLLNGGCIDDQDWITLAKKLGYKKNKIDKFSDDLNPALALIADWIVSSGNTSLSVDMLVTYLEQMNRDDIVDVIHRGQGQCTFTLRKKATIQQVTIMLAMSRNALFPGHNHLLTTGGYDLEIGHF